MSYARFDDYSDVYMYHHYQGFIECCGCWISDDIPEGYEDVPASRLNTPRRAIMHLMEHISRGYKVSDETFDRIYDEYKENMDEPLKSFLDTPEQQVRQKKRLDKLRAAWKAQMDADEA
jgi:hypothetical protein